MCLKSADGLESASGVSAAADRLAGELDDQRIQILFRSANALHRNFYEGDMSEDEVVGSLRCVEKITRLLATVID